MPMASQDKETPMAEAQGKAEMTKADDARKAADRKKAALERATPSELGAARQAAHEKELLDCTVEEIDEELARRPK